MPPKKDKAAAPSTDLMTFEESIGDLEQIVNRLEAGQLGLDESLTQYQHGVERLKHCHRLLETAERKIRLLQGLDDDGQPITEPFDEGDATLEEKSRSRSKRRSSDSKTTASRRRSDENSVDASEGLF